MRRLAYVVFELACSKYERARSGPRLPRRIPCWYLRLRTSLLEHDRTTTHERDVHALGALRRATRCQLGTVVLFEYLDHIALN